MSYCRIGQPAKVRTKVEEPIDTSLSVLATSVRVLADGSCGDGRLPIRASSGVMSAPEAPSFMCVRPTLRLKLCGRGPRAEADAARRLPHVTRRAAGGVPP